MTVSDATLKRTRSRARTDTPPLSLTLWHREGTLAVPLAAGQSLVVGREVPSDVVLADWSLSRQHARFTASNGTVEFEDLDSTNGVLVQGKAQRSGKLQPGETVMLGDVAVVLQAAPLAAAVEAGLESHERFAARVEDEERRARAFGRTFAVLMIRARNDLHASAIAPQLKAHLRDIDVLGAYGPSTLELLVPELDPAGAEALARKLSAVECRPSVGVCCWPSDAASAGELLSRLREATWSGRPGAVAHAEVAPAPQGTLLFQSPAMKKLSEAIAQVAAADLPVLVLGETGTGKELVARAVHQHSRRAKGPLKALNCAALPATLLESALFGHEKGAFTGAEKRAKGIFEQAEKGTVFLDEIGELSAAAQAALLRVLETRTLTRVGGDEELHVDVRVVAATHRDLERLSEQGTFRADLLFRLNTVTLEVPPLRERVDDVPLLAQHFLAQSTGKARSVSAAALEALTRHSWPGNVRELRNVIERAAVMTRGETIALEDLPPKLRGAPPPPRPQGGLSLPPVDEKLDYHARVKVLTSELERGIILEALQQSGGNQTAAAERLKLPLRTLTHKMQALGIKKRFDGQ